VATVRKRTRIAANGEEKIAWVADYHDQHKVRHIKTFRTKKAAAAWLVETQGEVSRGVHTPERASIDVWEAAQLWLERGKVEALERGTMRGYEAVVRLHIGPTLGPVKLAQLSTPMLEGWRDRLLAGTEHKKALSRRLARKVLAILKAILNEAQRRGLVAQRAALQRSRQLAVAGQRHCRPGRQLAGDRRPDRLRLGQQDVGVFPMMRGIEHLHHRGVRVVAEEFAFIQAQAELGLAERPVDAGRRRPAVELAVAYQGAHDAQQRGFARRDLGGLDRQSRHHRQIDPGIKYEVGQGHPRRDEMRLPFLQDDVTSDLRRDSVQQQVEPWDGTGPGRVDRQAD
jgi:hypothetical protein